jgi:plastocyanin
VKPRPVLVIALGLLAVLTTAACGDKSKVGNDQLLNFKDQANNRLGVTTTTGAPAPTTTAAGGAKAGVGAATTQKPTTTTAAPVVVSTTTTARPAPVTEIAIYGDSGPSQFEPAQAAAYVGGVFRWTNKDSVARSVLADDGSFTSPSLPPGGTFELKAQKAGTFNYHDGTRPYAVGAIQVIAR